MPQFYPSLSNDLADWCLKQSVFFVASAPLVGKHINVSPKGLPAASLAVLGSNQIAYVDSTGSGAETISHIYENGRVTMLFCSFDASPRILRLFTTGTVVEKNTTQYNELLERMGKTMSLEILAAARAIILLNIFKVQTSCGYGVPILTDEGFKTRDTLSNWGNKTVEKGELANYQAKNNRSSLDGCKGLKIARRHAGETLVVEDIKAWLRRLSKAWDVVFVGVLIGLAFGVLFVYGFEMLYVGKRENW